MKYIYADYAATTPADKRVVKAASVYFSQNSAIRLHLMRLVLKQKMQS